MVDELAVRRLVESKWCAVEKQDVLETMEEAMKESPEDIEILVSLWTTTHLMLLGIRKPDKEQD